MSLDVGCSLRRSAVPGGGTLFVARSNGCLRRSGLLLRASWPRIRPATVRCWRNVDDADLAALLRDVSPPIGTAQQNLSVIEGNDVQQQRDVAGTEPWLRHVAERWALASADDLELCRIRACTRAGWTRMIRTVCRRLKISYCHHQCKNWHCSGPPLTSNSGPAFGSQAGYPTLTNYAKIPVRAAQAMKRHKAGWILGQAVADQLDSLLGIVISFRSHSIHVLGQPGDPTRRSLGACVGGTPFTCPDCPWINDFVWLDLMSIGRDTACCSCQRRSRKMLCGLLLAEHPGSR